MPFLPHWHIGGIFILGRGQHACWARADLSYRRCGRRFSFPRRGADGVDADLVPEDPHVICFTAG